MYLRPADAQRFGGDGRTHPVDGQALEDPAGDPVGEPGSIISTAQGRLEDHAGAGSHRAQEPGNVDVQPSGEPDDGQVDEPAEGMTPQLPAVPALGAGIAHGHRCGVDDGDVSVVGGTGDGQSDFCGVGRWCRRRG